MSKLKIKLNSNISDSADYIITILLNGVILSTSRFSDAESKSSKRKVTIRDAQESNTLRISALNDLERSIADLRSRYYSKGLTVQPFTVVVGQSADQITDYFVYFDNCLQRHTSYLSCVDTCFKVFHVLHLEYPLASYGPWLFIQKYFFYIETEFDKPSPTVSSLVAHLNSCE